MRIVLAAVIVALVVLPAQAQHKHGKKSDEAQQQLSAEQKKKKALEAEKAYRAALDKVPDQKPVDPWSNMR